MTLTIAWVRSKGDYEELLFCSDSRLRFGCAWDSCQKVFPLPRGDCAIGFAGDTQFAYPIIHAAINAVSLHRGSARRQVDLIEVKSVLVRAINAMLMQIGDLAHDKEDFDEPELRLVFGGYSWRRKKFVLWKFHFNPGEREFNQREIRAWRNLGVGRKLVILGDPEASYSAIRRAARLKESLPEVSNDVQLRARKRLIERLAEKGALDGSGLDMEPFEVIRDMIRENESPSVGGAPQLVKVYPHLNTQVFGVRWPELGGSGVSVLGRSLPKGEIAHIPVLDPDSLKIEVR